MVIDILMLMMGFIAWYFYYGFECVINGAKPGFYMPFREAFYELTWNLPFISKDMRLRFTKGNQEWANMLPGPLHLISTCVALPLAPFALYRLFLLFT